MGYHLVMGPIRRINSLLSVILSIALTGCSARTHTVLVDSINSGEEISGGTVYFYPSVKGVDTNDLQFIEFKSLVMQALLEKGYKEASELKSSHYLIFLSYDTGDPKRHTGVYSYSVPVYTPGQSYNWNSYNSSYGSSYGTATSSGTWSSTTRVASYDYTTYTSVILAGAYKTKDVLSTGGKAKEVWRTSVSITEGSGDLRRVFPFLVETAKPYFGSNTKGIVEVKVPIKSK